MLKKLHIPAFLLLVLLTGITACEKVIDLPLRESDARYVIEGYITSEDSCRVRLSQTKAFSDSNGFTGISGARITIQQDNNAPVLLSETARGIYESFNVQGRPGSTYRLQVEVGGQRFTSTSRMPAAVPLDSIYITLRQSFDGNRRKVVTALFNDPPGKGNAYRFIKYVNDVRDFRIFIFNDNLSDGRTIRSELRGGLATADTVRVQFQCIEDAVYRYWFTLDQNARGGDNSPSPANPVTNIQGGALGYFSAHTIQERSLIVQ
jgi:hypothetical protein